jgi:carboxypeptidase Q
LQANLAAKSQDLEDIAYASPGRNRVMGSEGHNNTVAYLVGSIEALGDYYTVYTQPFVALYSNTEGNLTVNGVEAEVEQFTYAPSGNVEAELVAVANLGCNATDFPAEVSGNIALISRGTCPFGTKVALAGSAGAAGAIIYNNAAGPVGSGTLGAPPNPDGDYISALSVSQEDGQAYLASLTAGETLTGVLIVDADQRNITT